MYSHIRTYIHRFICTYIYIYLYAVYIHIEGIHVRAQVSYALNPKP